MPKSVGTTLTARQIRYRATAAGSPAVGLFRAHLASHTSAKLI
jgi:hypothetical protein